jgi:hypothetical protein
MSWKNYNHPTKLGNNHWISFSMSLGKFIITPELSNNHQIFFSMSLGKCKIITHYGWRKWIWKRKNR